MIKLIFKKPSFTYTYLFVLLLIFFSGCKEEEFEITSTLSNVRTKALPVPSFDWENIDWMPTPPGQSKIPSPWSGQGSIATTYGMDIVNDRKASDGWVLMYNTFDENSSTSLINPYFILYNKYRGVMRVFFYTTTQFVSYSSYIKEGISINSPNYRSSMLNFLGNSFIDLKDKQTSYKQIQPAPIDGSAPFASNKWYMSAYEIAYDSSIETVPYQNIQLVWSLEYHNITKIELGGEIQGTISSILGGKPKKGEQIVSNLEKTGKVAGAALISGIGSEFFNKHAKDKETGENSIGLPKDIYKSILKGLSSAVSGNVGKLPETVIGLFSSILGGSSSTTNINLGVDLDVKLEGSSTNTGSFPSSPTSLWVPGTNISSTATGYIPLYNNPLGVFNVKDNIPPLKITGTDYLYFNINWDLFPNHINLTIPHIDFSQYVEINPELKKEATVTIRKQELILRIQPRFQFNYTSQIKSVTCEKADKWFLSSHEDIPDYYQGISLDCYVNPTKIHLYSELGGSGNTNPLYDFVVRFIIDVKPNNGAPTTILVKTFLLDTDQTGVIKKVISS